MVRSFSTVLSAMCQGLGLKSRGFSPNGNIFFVSYRVFSRAFTDGRFHGITRSFAVPLHTVYCTKRRLKGRFLHVFLLHVFFTEKLIHT